jgi:hypothetical protein
MGTQMRLRAGPSSTQPLPGGPELLGSRLDRTRRSGKVATGRTASALENSPWRLSRREAVRSLLSLHLGWNDIDYSVQAQEPQSEEPRLDRSDDRHPT